ncbi:hypothetical protein BKA65DRAFT_565203 [Rhexocercosporidium sp. MPI-PUGE-AT-0058]|nr:hypothetical protein BKA65DRAFT_565203 [Rhexocercosporidium sp. MPI-PUGE-AT-0058]
MYEERQTPHQRMISVTYQLLALVAIESGPGTNKSNVSPTTISTASSITLVSTSSNTSSAKSTQTNRHHGHTTDPLTHQEQQEEYAQRLSSIGTKIRHVEQKLITELNSIRFQLQDIGRACADAEKILNPTKDFPAFERAESSSSTESSELDSGVGMLVDGVYFIVDDKEKYAEIVRYIAEQERDGDWRAAIALTVAARKGEESSSQAP